MKTLEKSTAVILRQSGLAITQIAKKLIVSKSTVSRWVSDVVLTEEQKQKLKDCKNFGKNVLAQQKRMASYSNGFRERRRRYQQQGRELARSLKTVKPNLHLIGCMLYWGEGGKTDRASVVLTNCDPNLIDIFIKFLRDCYNVQDDKIRVRIDCYPDIASPQQIKEFWLDRLKLSSINVVPHTPKKTKTHKKQKYGVCRIVVSDVKLKQSIMGAIQEYGGFTEEKWLG